MKTIFFKSILVLIIASFCCGAGYVGGLPKIEGSVVTETLPQDKHKETAPQQPASPPILPLAPKNFSDIYSNTILKQGKYTRYLKTMDDIVPVLEKLKQIIENKEGFQKFCATSNVLNLYVTDLEISYKGKPERYYESYKQVIKVNKTISEVADCWRDTKKYSRIRWTTAKSKAAETEMIDKKLDSALKAINISLDILKEN